MNLTLLLRVKNWNRTQCFNCETDTRLVADPGIVYTRGPKLRVTCECGYEDKLYAQCNGDRRIQLVVRG